MQKEVVFIKHYDFVDERSFSNKENFQIIDPLLFFRALFSFTEHFQSKHIKLTKIDYALEEINSIIFLQILFRKIFRKHPTLVSLI